MLLFQLCFQTPRAAQESYSPKQTVELFSGLKYETTPDGQKKFLTLCGPGRVCSVQQNPHSKEPYTLSHSQPNYLTGAIERTSYKFQSDGVPTSVSKSEVYPDGAKEDKLGKPNPLTAQNRNELNASLREVAKYRG
jgi:hypothetical protein